MTPAGSFPGPQPLTYEAINAAGAGKTYGTELFVGLHPKADVRQTFTSRVK